MRLLSLFFLIILLSACGPASCQPTDSLSCNNNAARSWWDVRHYDLDLKIDTGTGYIEGRVKILACRIGAAGNTLQIDLKEPLDLKQVSVEIGDHTLWSLTTEKKGTHYLLQADWNKITEKDSLFTIVAEYAGLPQIAKQAPWDGGLVLDRDDNGHRWIGIACQGDGASTWFPCKDFQGDEPDNGMRLSMVAPASLQVIGNGRLLPGNERRSDGNLRQTWEVCNPINNYDITFYIGDYVHWTDTFNGVKGPLTLDYYVLRNNEASARRQFAAVKGMLACFEAKIGAYPFYEDGYKLVEAPYLGMEHQSAVAYGNGYKMGYKGIDRSKTGVGLLFDFIIVHESGHEWFGNSITTADKADTWVHEGFTTYTETIYAECLLGRDSAFLYQQGKAGNIKNDRPVQGAADACDEGSGDHYDKAAFMIHMIRQIMDNDTAFFGMLKEMNRRFYHKIVTGKAIEAFINEYSGQDLGRLFDQYLRESSLPVFEWRIEKGRLWCRWTQCVPGFDMPLRVKINGRETWLKPQTGWKSFPVKGSRLVADKNFLVTVKAASVLTSDGCPIRL